MQQHMKNGLAVAKYLESHPMVRKVIHPGLKNHPQHELALRQSTGFSGMVSLYMKGNAETVKIFTENLKLFILAMSLGSTESLIDVPALMTHSNLNEETRKKLGIDETMVRISVGIEETEDLLADLDQALAITQKFYDSKTIE
jgi:cystathionine gamma-lyase